MTCTRGLSQGAYDGMQNPNEFASRLTEHLQGISHDKAADAAALILDLRRNGGGNPPMVALVSSYLFGDEAVHLNSLYWRVPNRTDDFYTDPRVKGDKFGAAKPVYVFTSARTFSAAEEFAYNLQARKRATIVGEATGGGAHPGGGASPPHGLRIFVPSGRAINPITKTNWEGTGVIPDVAVAADAALDAAHKVALERVVRRSNRGYSSLQRVVDRASEAI